MYNGCGHYSKMYMKNNDKGKYFYVTLSKNI